MIKHSRFLHFALFLVVVGLAMAFVNACSSARRGEEIKSAVPDTPPDYPVKYRVTDVSNNTGELFDVDVIGLLWSALDESLRNRGMLWKGNAAQPPLSIEAEIVKYKKGDYWMRNFLPPFGDTTLSVRAHLKESGQLLATVESKKSISWGKEGFTRHAWRKIFTEVADEMVTELTRRR